MAWLDWAFLMAPLWLIGILLFLFLFLFFRIGLWLRLRGKRDHEGSNNEGYLLSAAMALLGLMIAFTFSLALNRYDARREMVIREANAIGTAWLRAGLASGEAGAGLQHAIAGYADLRLALPALTDPAYVAAVEQRTQRAQAALWARMKVTIKAMQPPIAASLIAAMNEMFDLAAARKAERSAHIPSEVLLVLILCAGMSVAIIGYVLADTSISHRTVTSILFLLLTVAILLILDLDRPQRGLITVSQQPMIDMRAGLH